MHLVLPIRYGIFNTEELKVYEFWDLIVSLLQTIIHTLHIAKMYE